jgi:hypothetical protein
MKEIERKVGTIPSLKDSESQPLFVDFLHLCIEYNSFIFCKKKKKAVSLPLTKDQTGMP